MSLGTKLCVTELHPLEGSAHAGNAATQQSRLLRSRRAGTRRPRCCLSTAERAWRRASRQTSEWNAELRLDLTQSKGRWWTCGFSSTTTRLVALSSCPCDAVLVRVEDAAHRARSPRVASAPTTSDDAVEEAPSRLRDRRGGTRRCRCDPSTAASAVASTRATFSAPAQDARRIGRARRIPCSSRASDGSNSAHVGERQQKPNPSDISGSRLRLGPLTQLIHLKPC